MPNIDPKNLSYSVEPPRKKSKSETFHEENQLIKGEMLGDGLTEEAPKKSSAKNTYWY